MAVELLRDTPYGAKGLVRKLGKGVEDILVTQGRARYVSGSSKQTEKKRVRKTSRSAKPARGDRAGNDATSDKREDTQ